MSGNSDTGTAKRRRAAQPARLVVGGSAVLLAWLLLPTLSFLVQPVAPAVRSEIAGDIEATTDPVERARLRLELAALEQEEAARRTGVRNGIATLLAFGVAAWGAVSAWQQLQDNRDQAEAVRKETDEQLRLARDGQITERYSRAVELLGSDNLDVRLGAVYALGRVGVDSKDDAPIVIELLAAFVRRHSPRKTPMDDKESEHSADSALQGRQRAPFLWMRSADVQAALNVLGTIERGSTRLIELNLIYTDLEGADLTGADLRGAWLNHAILTGAMLINAKLNDARLGGAILNGVNLAGTRLRDAKLPRADLLGADLSLADLVGADLTAARADAKTKWPDGFDPEAAGVGFVDRA